MSAVQQIKPDLKYNVKQHHAEQHHINKNTILIRSLLQRKREFFNSGKTRDVQFRIEQLKKLRNALQSNRDQILKALWDDLKKPGIEAYTSEIGILTSEINHALANIKRWDRSVRVGTPRVYAPANSMVIPEPYGMVLIIGPWNYPFQLMVAPLVGAIAAGNTAVLKPSEFAPRSSEALSRIIGSAFDAEYVSVVQGGVDAALELLNEKFDYIFFTGGAETGKSVMQAAARHLTPVTLELGGKSPAIVDRSASIDLAARKIAWGKYINAGQTCTAPDYVLVHQDVKDTFIDRIRHYIREFYGDNPKLSRSYARIVNERHFHRIARLLRSGNKVIGGRIDSSQLYVEPTVIDEVNINLPIMKEEIFGPVLPVMKYKNINEAVSTVKSLPKPLAVYVFSNDSKMVDHMIRSTSSGGVCVNDVVVQIGNYYLPFGGVGESGMGAYHGRAGFETFSHLKSVMKRSRFSDNPRRYPPFTNRKRSIIKKIFG